MMRPDALRRGMRVLDSEGAELGVVDQVLVSPDGRDAVITLCDSGGNLSVGEVTAVEGDVVRMRSGSAPVLDTSSGDLLSGYNAVESFDWQGGGGSFGESETVRVQRYEERLSAEKRVIEAGTIQVHKSVVETPESITMDVVREEYDIERVPVDREWQPGDEVQRVEGDTVIIPIIAERLFVMRRKFVTEELRLTRRTVTEQQEFTETVRKEVVDVSGPVEKGLASDAGSAPPS